MAAFTYSFVVPVYNDAEALARLLGVLMEFEVSPEILVVDASPDKSASREVAERYGVLFLEAEKASRGAQLIQGAQAATGDVLVFNHADTYFEEQHLLALDAALQSDGNLQAGAFLKDMAWHYPKMAWSSAIYRWYARHLGILYGDQSVFVKREFYEALGGIRDIPIMEDVEFSARLRKGTQCALLDPPLRTSMRKFEREGALLRKVQNMALVNLFRLGVSPERIYRWYYRRRVSRGA
jgi:rSAM/selenodomain-associated transferase 2